MYSKSLQYTLIRRETLHTLMDASNNPLLNPTSSSQSNSEASSSGKHLRKTTMPSSKFEKDLFDVDGGIIQLMFNP